MKNNSKYRVAIAYEEGFVIEIEAKSKDFEIVGMEEIKDD